MSLGGIFKGLTLPESLFMVLRIHKSEKFLLYRFPHRRKHGFQCDIGILPSPEHPSVLLLNLIEFALRKISVGILKINKIRINPVNTDHHVPVNHGSWQKQISRKLIGPAVILKGSGRIGKYNGPSAKRCRPHMLLEASAPPAVILNASYHIISGPEGINIRLRHSRKIRSRRGGNSRLIQQLISLLICEQTIVHPVVGGKYLQRILDHAPVRIRLHSPEKHNIVKIRLVNPVFSHILHIQADPLLIDPLVLRLLCRRKNRLRALIPI